MTTCPACGHPGDHDGPAHAYISPSPACWARYGEVLTREYSDRDYWQAHRLLTDAYCGQHSVGEDRRARQSLYIHLAALMLHFEDAVPADRIVAFLRKAAKSGNPFNPLPMPQDSVNVRIDDVHAARDVREHSAAVTDYARAVYDVWAPQHDVFRRLNDEVGI
ncbi:MAG: hypothetical protein GKR99_01045 [Rhodobacteraceae bacterium]|nr:hypothetical protein [Paracoccaceae bacterium]